LLCVIRYTDDRDGPQFSAVYIGLLKMVGNVMMLVGIVIYSRYLSTWEYRKIFTYMQVHPHFSLETDLPWLAADTIFCTQILSAGVSLLDIFIVSRLNKTIGIPDEAMIIGDTTLAPLVMRFIMVPVLSYPLLSFYAI
jgi:hypothetical protein